MNPQILNPHTGLSRSLRHVNPVRTWLILIILVCGLLFIIALGMGSRGRALASGFTSKPTATHRAWCDQFGWAPTGFGLKDHTIFRFDGAYYIVSIRTPKEMETAFVYARSTDLCNWEELGVILSDRIRGEWDESYVWAPFVLEENGIFYLYYTGVNRYYTQSIMLAISTNPADPESWQRVGVVFQPNHVGMRWQTRRWADCRDASVEKIGDIYYMVYTGRNKASPIIGWATAIDPAGPWHDRGANLTLSQGNAMAESPFVAIRAGLYYLIYNNTAQGEEYRIGKSQVGPWSEPYPLPPGWANEMWVGHNGLVYTSFLDGYDLVIGRPVWDDAYSPARLSVKAGNHLFFIPFLYKQQQ
jgi:Glycosyl hydrolases family 43